MTPTAESGEVPVELGVADSVKAVPTDMDAVLVDKSQKSQVTQHTELIDSVEAPVAKGQRLGTLYVKAGEQVLKEIPLVAESGVDKLTFFQLWGRVLRKLVMCG